MTNEKTEKRRLGRGLSALLSNEPESQVTSSSSGSSAAREYFVPIEALSANPDQPRRQFDDESLQDLAKSITEKGILQPIIVRELPTGAFQIVAGERRWRAAQLAKLHEVPVVVRQYSDREMLEVAIIENIQRANLNPLEEAMGFKDLQEKLGHTQEILAQVLGKSRSYIANSVRLLQLPQPVQAMVSSGQLSSGHARTLITALDPVKLAHKIVAEGLSVRRAEALVRSELQRRGQTDTPRPKDRASADPETQALEADLSEALGMAVRIAHESGGESGVLSVRYSSLNDLDLLCDVLSRFRRDTA